MLTSQGEADSASFTVPSAWYLEVIDRGQNALAASHARRFDELLRQRSVVTVFQPLVRLSDAQIIGYELLGRGNYAGLPRNPMQLLHMASGLNRDIELSELFREVGLQQAHSIGNRYTLFLNAAPKETGPERLAESLRVLRERASHLPLVLEVHESSITELAALSRLRALLNDLGIELAYDDFGVGQARLLDIIEVPPDWLKFDLQLVRSLRQPASPAWQVLEALVSMAQDLGIKTVAEGVENDAEMAACKQLGFDVAQGYHIGWPLPLAASL